MRQSCFVSLGIKTSVHENEKTQSWSQELRGLGYLVIVSVRRDRQHEVENLNYLLMKHVIKKKEKGRIRNSK